MSGNGSATSASALLDSVDLSDNDDLVVDGGVDALWHFANASTLKLRGATLPAVMFTRWLKAVPTHLRHLDVSGTRTLPPLTEWRYCAPCLEWLDVSGMALRRLELSAKCPIQWLYAEDNQIKEIVLIDKASSVYGSSLRALHLGNNRLSAWPFPAPSRRAYSVARTSPPNTNLYAVTAAKTPTPPAVALMLDASAFPQLETLSLTANAIKGEIRAEDFGTLPALAHLDLSLNRLDAIFDTIETDGAILSPRLEFLNLSGNTIRRLSGRHWPNLPALSVLDLSGNRLDTFGSSDENTVSYEKQLSPNGYSSQLTASVGAGWYVASAGTWDPYGASGLFVSSNVGNDDARAAAGKRRVKDDVNSLLRRLPALQHLHLARNGRVPAGLAQWLDGAGNASNPAAFCLVELDVAECGMPRQPDLSRLPHLTILHMAGNAFTTLDGTRLPPCAVSVDASRNGIERVQDIDDAQLACLRHLRLAENALRCNDADCTLHRLLPNALQQQDDFYDRTEYYCFTDDGWRHPLSAYLDAHATACQNYNTERTITPVFDAHGSERHHPLYHHYYGGGGRTRHPESAAFHFLGFLLVFIAVTLLILAVSLRAARWATRQWRGDITVSTSSAFAYKLVPQSAVSDADGCFDDGDGPPVVHL